MTEATQQTTWNVELSRTEFISRRGFDDVLADIHSGLGHPHFADFIRRIGAIRDWDGYRAAVEAEAGSSGLMVFLELDMGAVISRDPSTVGSRLVRIIAGNPITMEAMTKSTPGAGAFAPVTILVFEATNGVRIRYDSLTSAVGDELTQAASTVASKLDAAVLDLLKAASAG